MLKSSQTINTTGPIDMTAEPRMIASGQTAYINGSYVTGTLGTVILDHHGLAPNISSTYSSYNFSSATNSNYAMFIGNIGYIETYNSSLTHSSISNSGIGSYHYIGSGTIGQYCVFGGGMLNSGYSGQTLAIAVDNSLTITQITSYTSGAANQVCGSNSQYLVLASGLSSDSDPRIKFYCTNAYCYNSSLTMTSLTYSSDSMSGVVSYYHKTWKLNDYAVLVGNGANIKCYSNSLTASDIATGTGAVTHRNIANFNGNGLLYDGPSSQCKSLDNSLVFTSLSTLPNLNSSSGPVSCGGENHGYMFGGYRTVDSSSIYTLVDVFDKSYTLQVGEPLFYSHDGNPASATIGEYCLCANSYNQYVEFYRSGPFCHVSAQTVVI